MRILISACAQESDAIIIIGHGWDKVVNIQNINIIADGETNIVIATPIYPAPMMNVNKEYSTILNPLANSLLISDKDTIFQDLYMEMAEESGSHHVVDA